jgi:hypothetical protein
LHHPKALSWFSLITLIAITSAGVACARPPAAVDNPSPSVGDGTANTGTPQPSAEDVVPWIDAVARAYVEPTARPLPLDAPPCRAADLATKVDAIGVGLGNTNLPVRFVNQGPDACLLAGYPTIAGITATGMVVPLDLRQGSYFGDPGPTTNIEPEGIVAINISGADACDDAVAGKTRVFRTLRIDLPGGGPIDVPGNGFDTICGVSVSQFGVTAVIDAPPTAVSGTVLEFAVTLANPGGAPITYATCPAYQEFVGSGDKGWVATIYNYYLNCTGLTIATGAKATFAMRLKLPLDQPAGFAKFGWNLQGDAGPWANAPLTIVSP